MCLLCHDKGMIHSNTMNNRIHLKELAHGKCPMRTDIRRLLEQSSYIKAIENIVDVPVMRTNSSSDDLLREIRYTGFLKDRVSLYSDFYAIGVLLRLCMKSVQTEIDAHRSTEGGKQLQFELQ